MKTAKKQSYLFLLFAVLYFPFVYFGQLSMSAYFVVSDGAAAAVNYMGAFYNVAAVLFLLTRSNFGSSSSDEKWIVAVVVWCLLAMLNSIVNASDVGRIFKDFNYGTMWTTHLLFYYVLARDGYLRNKLVIYLFASLAVFSAVMTFRLFNAFVYELGGVKALGFNAVYFVVCLLPWVFLIEKKWIKFGIIIFLCVAVLFSQKRTAIIALALQFVIYLLDSMRSPKNRFFKVVGAIILLVALVYAFNTVNQNYLNGGITKRFEMAETDDMGSRVAIWRDLIDNYLNSNVFYQLFGRGCESFLNYGKYHLTAHNDYLETLFDYGLISLIVLFVIVCCLLGRVKQTFTYDRILGVSYLSSLVAFLVMTMSSHLLFIHPCSIVFITAMWGYSIGSVEYNNKINSTERK